MSPHDSLMFVALAIRMRDNAEKLSPEEFEQLLKEVAWFGVMSNRQLAKLCKYRMSHVRIGKIIPKISKTGGEVNPSDLEKMRAIIFSKSINQVDYKLVLDVASNGTSQRMLSRITGISQGLISRKKNDGSFQ